MDSPGIPSGHQPTEGYIPISENGHGQDALGQSYSYYVSPPRSVPWSIHILQPCRLTPGRIGRPSVSHVRHTALWQRSRINTRREPNLPPWEKLSLFRQSTVRLRHMSGEKGRSTSAIVIHRY
jgi:hypothetical protein